MAVLLFSCFCVAVCFFGWCLCSLWVAVCFSLGGVFVLCVWRFVFVGILFLLLVKVSLCLFIFLYASWIVDDYVGIGVFLLSLYSGFDLFACEFVSLHGALYACLEGGVYSDYLVDDVVESAFCE